MRFFYQFEDKLYTLSELRLVFPQVSLPLDPLDEDLVSLGVTVLPETALPSDPEGEVTLAQAKVNKLTEINAVCDVVLDAVTAGYPRQERLTFDKQETEARAWMQDNTAPIPLLTALAGARGMPLDTLVQRVMSKAEALAFASGVVIGQRQALEDKLDRCETAEQVRDINAHVIRLPAGTL